jgi:hypothetical protein
MQSYGPAPEADAQKRLLGPNCKGILQTRAARSLIPTAYSAPP